MELKEPEQINIRQYVSIKNKKGFFSGDKLTVFHQHSRAAKQFGLFSNAHTHTGLLFGSKLPNNPSVYMCIHQNVSDSGSLAVVKPYLQQRDASNRQQAFGNAVC